MSKGKRRRTRARPGRRSQYNRCQGCGKRMINRGDLFCIDCEVKKIAREALFTNSSSKRIEITKEERMHIPKMGK